MIIGEDPEDYDTSKPVRLLTDFIIFDPGHDNELVSLNELLDANTDRQFEAVGNVLPVFVNDEDAGLDDDVESGSVQRIRTTSIFSFTMDYSSTE